MKNLISQIQIQVNENIFLKDPNSSELGKKMIHQSILMIHEIGFESFTFRKLASQLKTAESSVYRYFENKHKLLIYLISWYWGWMEYRLVFGTNNIKSAEERLRLAIEMLTQKVAEDEVLGHINSGILSQIVVSESSKAYLTKEVDEANKEGFYAGYKRMVGRVSEIVLEINPKFKHPHTLISTIIEGIHHQKYFADHLPSLTDFNKQESQLATFYTNMALAIIHKK